MAYGVTSARRRFVIAAALPLLFALITLQSQRSSSVYSESNEFQKKFHALLRRGVGTEVLLARPNASAESVRSSVNSVVSFIHSRSGFKLDKAAVERLAKMEERALKDSRLRVSAAELSDILARTLFERISSLSDVEIEKAAETLRGFDDPDLPEKARAARRCVKLRADRVCGLSPEEFVNQVKILRSGETIAALAMGKAREEIGRATRSRLDTLGEAVPEQWGAAQQNGFTPLQAFLIAYSVVSDDYLWYSENELKGLMKSKEKIYAGKFGHYPSSEGRFAYGSNGYVFSAPLDIVFDARAVTVLLDRAEKRSAK